MHQCRRSQKCISRQRRSKGSNHLSFLNHILCQQILLATLRFLTLPHIQQPVVLHHHRHLRNALHTVPKLSPELRILFARAADKENLPAFRTTNALTYPLPLDPPRSCHAAWPAPIQATRAAVLLDNLLVRFPSAADVLGAVDGVALQESALICFCALEDGREMKAVARFALGIL